MKSAAFTKTYSGRLVLTMPEMIWEPGSITAVIGANGSGKSTLGKVFCGVERADGKRSVLADCSVGYLPQKPYALRMSVEKNILLNGGDRTAADEMMNALNLTTLRKSRANRLSGGETAKMSLARLLMKQYDLLILDEPTAAMDLESTAAAERLIDSYAEKKKAAVLLITHSLSQAMRLSERVLYLESGNMKEFGKTKLLLKEPKTAELQRFLAFYGT